MAIIYTRRYADKYVNSDGNVFTLTISMEGTDNADSDIETNNASLTGKVSIAPVAILTKTIVDNAETTYRATIDSAGDNVDVQIANIITAKQLASATVSRVDYNSLPT